MFFSLLPKSLSHNVYIYICFQCFQTCRAYFDPGKICWLWNPYTGDGKYQPVCAPFQPHELSHALCSPSPHVNCVHTVCCSCPLTSAIPAILCLCGHLIYTL